MILVRSLEDIKRLPEAVQNSNAIIMTIGQSKGLEFEDVFLYDFFNNSLAGSEWNVLWDVKKSLDAGEPSAAGDQNSWTGWQQAGAEHRAVKPSPRKFCPWEDVLLSEEFKHLYTAVTRTMQRLVIFDSNAVKRAPFFDLLLRFGVADLVHG